MQNTNLHQTVGEHSPEAYVRLLYELCKSKKSGVLSIHGSQKVHQLMLVEGLVVAAQGDVIVPLTTSLQEAGLTTAADLSQVNQQEQQSLPIEDLLLTLGVLTADELNEHQKQQLQYYIGVPLQWKKGKWSFAERSDIDALRIDPMLYDDSSLHTLWLAVLEHFDTAVVEEQLKDLTFRVSPDFASQFYLFQMPGALEQLPKHTASGANLGSLQESIGDESHLLKGIWLLYQVNLLTTLENPVWANPLAQLTGDKPKSASTSKTDRKRKLIKVVRADYRKRMGQDYYAFIGIEAEASKVEIVRAVRRLLKRWRSIKESVSLDPDSGQKLEGLLDGLQMVQSVLGQTQSKIDYDRKLRYGRAPIIGVKAPTPSVSKGQSKELEAIHKMIHRGEFGLAIPLLQALRRKGPLSAGVMAALGWCQWNTGSHDEADDAVFMALQLQPDHTIALEYAAKIAINQNKAKVAKKHLVLLLQKEPNHLWAKNALAQLSSDEQDVMNRGY